ncbi:MAG: N-acetylmuramoyl-L-alanine amidase [Clostridia bacterium]|nr:N-acetylmuramoyl-L-alanine amidase [Clostridia bacterium]
MKKNKILIAAIVGIAVVIAGIITAMFATGKFDSLKSIYNSESTTAAVSESTTQQEVIPSGRPKSKTPDSVVAAVYSSYSENSPLELALFEGLGFNTVIFNLTAENTNDVAALLETAKANNLYFGIKVDASKSTDYITSFTEKNNIDFIILGGCDETIAVSYGETVGTLCKILKETDSFLTIGLEPVYNSKTSEAMTALIADKTADFIFLSHEKGKESSFKSAHAVWNEETAPLWLCHDLNGLSSYSTNDASSAIELVSASADMSMCKGLAFSPFNDIANASGTAADIVKNYIKKRDTYLLDKDFSITNYKTTKITVEQSKITFRGTSSPAYDLICNGQKLSVAKNGDFSLDCQLSAGENTIKFEHKGKTYTYKVTYKIKLLKSVSPSENISVPGGMLVEVFAVAHKNANVSVTFNGKTYKMTETDYESDSEDTSPDEASDFTTFTATLETPASTSSVQKLGKYKVTAKYDTLSESLSGASVTVTAKEVVTAPPTTQPVTTKPVTTTEAPTSKPITTESGNTDISVNTPSESQVQSEAQTQSQIQTAPGGNTLQKYFYTDNYGLGSAKICEVIDDYVETYPGNDTKTYSVPDCSPLLKGTVDYVNGSPITLDGDTYYILASGLKVPTLREERLASGSNGKVTHISIKDGYIMPKNSIKVLSCRSMNGKTVIVLEMNRSVAFTAKLTGQTYGKYNNRPVSVSSLDCTGLDFVFSDTVTAEGSFSFMDSVIKSAKWSSDSSASTVTLSMQLANKGKFYGFHYEYDNDGNLVITVKHKPSSTLSGYTIMLDPGHGGVDPGADCAVSSASFGDEKHINLSIATKIRELLEAEGAKVLMTRTDDKWVCYTDRNNAVRENNPDMFISVHCDSSTSASAMGTSAYYYRAYSQPLAKAVHTNIVNAYKSEIYKEKSADFQSKISRGANFYAFRVARVEECPAILIEYGFVSNTEECQILQTAANRDILAAATVQGIKDYISQS